MCIRDRHMIEHISKTTWARDFKFGTLLCVRNATGSAQAAASDIHRQLPTHMADIRHDWPTNQNTDWCFVVIGLTVTYVWKNRPLGRKISHSPLQQLKIDPVRRTRPPYWLASSGGQRIFINIRGQYGIQKNIYIHPWEMPSKRTNNFPWKWAWPRSRGPDNFNWFHRRALACAQHLSKLS